MSKPKPAIKNGTKLHDTRSGGTLALKIAALLDRVGLEHDRCRGELL